jgi:hypothetical protein
MSSKIVAIFLFAAFLNVSTELVAQNSVSVDLEVVVPNQAALGTQQKWAEALQDSGADNIRVRQARSAEKVDIIPSGEDKPVYYKIIAIVDERNRLNVPNARFEMRQMAQLKEYIQKIRDDGARTALAEKMAFGLTAEQLVALHEDLSGPIEVETRGTSSKEFVRYVARSIKTQITLDAQALATMDGKQVITEELAGISKGTALAAAMRPLGLVVVPTRKQGEALQLLIRDSRNSDEIWPVGWPLDQPRTEVAPKLFETLDAEIENFVLKDTLDAIQAKVEMPFLLDQNSMARHGIELDQFKVTYVKNKVSYAVMIDKILRQSKPTMTYDLRMDEAGNPFLWIAPRNP